MIKTHVRPGWNLLKSSVRLTKSFLDAHALVGPQFRQVEVGIGLLGEDEQSHLCSFLLQVLDEESNLHGTPAGIILTLSCH